jgi:predicted phage-related endonuclease
MDIAASHRTGIGGSGAAALFGCGFKTLHEFYAECVGIAPKFETSLPMAIGNHNEPFIREWYEKEIGMKGGPKFFRHHEHDWMLGHVDWISDDGTKFAEFKVAGLHSQYEWGNPKYAQVPMGYLLQGMHYSILTGLKEWDFVVMIGTEIRIYPCKYDLEIAAELIAREKYFWENHVVPRVPPPPDHSKECEGVLRWTYKQTSEDVPWAEGAEDRLLNTLAMVETNLEAEEKNYQEIRNKVMEAIGNRAGLKNSKIQVTWKANKAGSRVFKTKLIGDEA